MGSEALTLADTRGDRASAMRASEADDAPRPCSSDVIADRCLRTLLKRDWRSDAALSELGSGLSGEIADLVAAATRVARILGERWVADTCSFADVTLGLHRLTLLLFAIEALPDPQRERLHGGSVLLALAPGDQHGFGLATVALALRRAGWDVTVDLAGDADALVATARRGFDCIGLSVGHDRAVPQIARLIARLRAAARPRRTTIAVGGPMLLRDAGLAATVGADIAAVDGFTLATQLRPLRAVHAA